MSDDVIIYPGAGLIETLEGQARVCEAMAEIYAESDDPDAEADAGRWKIYAANLRAAAAEIVYLWTKLPKLTQMELLDPDSE